MESSFPAELSELSELSEGPWAEFRFSGADGEKYKSQSKAGLDSKRKNFSGLGIQRRGGLLGSRTSAGNLFVDCFLGAEFMRAFVSGRWYHYERNVQPWIGMLQQARPLKNGSRERESK